MNSILSLTLFSVPLLHREVVTDRVPSTGQIEQFDQELFNHLSMIKQMTDIELFVLVAILKTI